MASIEPRPDLIAKANQATLDTRTPFVVVSGDMADGTTPYQDVIVGTTVRPNEAVLYTPPREVLDQAAFFCNGTLVVTTNGGPGSGKSTSSAHLYALLKWGGIDAELVTEYAKGKTYEGAPAQTLANQIKVFGKQHDYLNRVIGKADVVVTDASLMNSLVYGDTDYSFKQVVLSEVRRMGGLHFFIERRKAYNPRGRSQTFEEAKAIDGVIKAAFDEHKIPYESLVGGEDVAFRMYDRVLSLLAGQALLPTAPESAPSP